MFPPVHLKPTLTYEFPFSVYNYYKCVMTLEHGIELPNLWTWVMVTHIWLHNEIPFFSLRCYLWSHDQQEGETQFAGGSYACSLLQVPLQNEGVWALGHLFSTACDFSGATSKSHRTSFVKEQWQVWHQLWLPGKSTLAKSLVLIEQPESKAVPRFLSFSLYLKLFNRCM